MAAQDLRELIPRVRRALEGPVPLPTGALTDDQLLAVTADALADIILFTYGQWPHTLEVTERDEDTEYPTEWAVDPALTIEEESVIAYQAAISYYFHVIRSEKISESISNEGQSWEWQRSANLLRDQIKLLQDQRDRALKALLSAFPAFARYASILAVRDQIGAALLEPWASGSGRGGYEVTQIGP